MDRMRLPGRSNRQHVGDLLPAKLQPRSDEAHRNDPECLQVSPHTAPGPGQIVASGEVQALAEIVLEFDLSLALETFFNSLVWQVQSDQFSLFQTHWSSHQLLPADTILHFRTRGYPIYPATNANLG